MPRSYATGVQASLDAGRVIDRMLILIDLASGLRGFWTGLGPFTYNGVTYVGAGSLISIEGIQQGSDQSAVQVVGRLTSIPNTDLTPDILATIENETYHQRPATITTAYFDPDSTGFLGAEVEYRGYIDRIVHSENHNGDAVLEVHLESRFRDHQRAGYRMRSHNDQQRIAPGDMGLMHLAMVEHESVSFGKQKEIPTATTQQFAPVKKKSFFERIFG